MTKRAHNFCAGPCTLPVEVLEEVQQEFVNYHETGMSLIEMSHRAREYDEVHREAMQLAIEVFEVPDDFSVLFIQGGATLQFAMVPMNLLAGGGKAGYVNSGSWAQGAMDDGRHYGNIYTAWDGAENRYTRMPAGDEIAVENVTRYLHITSNETIGGIRFFEWPSVDVPIVADMSSDYMSRRIPWERFDLVYGGVQKNLGPAGMAMVFVRKSVLQEIKPDVARYLRYDVHLDKESLFNTPPVFTIYMVGKVLKWMKEQGGIGAMERRAEKKAAILYDTIDNSGGYYNCPVDEASRSHMNIVFRLPSENREKSFLQETGAENLLNLKGHRSVGGCRASIYNAMPESSVRALAGFMVDFQQRNG
ncbi:MAG: Phosphoserine aminotransferase [Gammaproteobacteria bacterium]|nr:Phosphoserine aminotransferase [Gammaproteobacteria bacterium]